MSTNPASAAASLRSVFFAVVLVASAAAGRADSPAPLAPPHYPDSTHIFNGCHLSAMAYLAHFRAEFPAEHGRPLVVQMMNADGRIRSHTMALVSWRGEWWVRDEYFGVFPLECAATETNPARLTARTERCYARHVATVAHDAVRPPEPPARFSAEQRAHDVTAAAAKLPVAHTVYWIKDGAREIPVVFFRPTPGVVAVYDPVRGTGMTTCNGGNDAKITALVAASFGYRVEDIRADAADDGVFAASVASLFAVR